MKVLWLISIVLPIIAKELSIKHTHYGGGWLTGISNALLEDKRVELAVCMPSKNDSEIRSGNIRNIKYYFYPEKNELVYNYKTEKYLKKIVDDYKPDIIHAFGTEYPRVYSLLNAVMSEKVVISITGMVSVYWHHYFGDIPKKYYNKNYFRRLLSLISPISTISQGRDSFYKRGKYEIEVIKKAKHIIGRTTWDLACVKQINPNINYHFCNEILRDSFYSSKWCYENCIPHSIFVSQAGYPLKGFHKLLLALPIIKEQFPDVKVFVGGTNMITRPSKIRQIALHISNEYSSYLYRLISKLKLNENVIFSGPLDEKQMVDAYLKANVFVLPSSIENSPNSLGEAMILGVPCVAACVGGVQDMLRDREDGYIYPFDEHYMLAYYICKIFSDKKLALKFSSNARAHALVTHDIKSNRQQLLDIYLNIINETSNSSF